MGYQTGLPAALAREGLTVELVPGYATRGSSSFNPHGSVSHWTAGPARGDRPSLAICVNGRSDLAGPLCNVFLTRAGVAVVVALGRANHAGAGGFRGLVGNSSVWGTEAESDGRGWTVEQRDAYPRVNAAYARLSGFDASWCCGHNEWAPHRKRDVEDWPMPSMRSQVAAILRGASTPTEDDDMTPAQSALLDEIATRVRNMPGDMWTVPRLSFDPARVKDQPPYALLATASTAALDASGNAALAAGAAGKVDVAALADALRAQMAQAELDDLASRLRIVADPA